MSAAPEGGFINFTCGVRCNIDKQEETNLPPMPPTNGTGGGVAVKLNGGNQWNRLFHWVDVPKGWP